MNIKPIKSEEDYIAALNQIESLMDAKPNTPQMDEQEGLKQKDLVDIVGSKSRVSEILNRKRKLTIEMIRNLHKQLHIPIESLFLDYKTSYV